MTTSFVYDEAQFLEERPGTGTPKRYVYGLGIDRPVAQAVGSTTSYFVTDHLGSIAQETDSVGTLILSREFDPWGNLLQGATTGGYAFTGREWDAETSLYYYRARYYAPLLGRFLGEDPAGYAGGINRYSYVGNEPLRHNDPAGLLRVENAPSDAKEEQIRDALKKVIDKLENSCCAGKHRKQLLAKAKDPNLTIVYHVKLGKGDLGDCGYCGLGAGLGLKNKINVAEIALKGACCNKGPQENSLPSTIMHELVHVRFGRQGTAYALEEKCWGCKPPDE